MSKRYVVECVWSGYRSSQSRPCHRTVIDKYLAKRLERFHTISFTDGTTLSVNVRPCTYREKVTQLNGYGSLLSDFAYRDDLSGYVSVMDLHEATK